MPTDVNSMPVLCKFGSFEIDFKTLHNLIVLSIRIAASVDTLNRDPMLKVLEQSIIHHLSNIKCLLSLELEFIIA